MAKSYEIQIRQEAFGKVTWETVCRIDGFIYRYPDEASAWDALAKWYPTVMTIHCAVRPTNEPPNMRGLYAK